MSKKEEKPEELDDKDNALFRKLRKLINLIDQLRDVGVNEYIKLPRICSLGTQSSGKSSVLESIVGLDFLPRGDGVVTRRPLELRLCHISSGQPYAYFEEVKGTKFTDFVKVRETIEKLTDDVCKENKNIVDKPIVLNVYSSTCPDLTLVDLPGVTRVPVGDQPKNIEEITKNMATRYISDPLTIILCVIAANSDIATSDGLKLARDIDVGGYRTLGVLTKLDIMDEGTDARKALLNEEIRLRLGYVGVKNRSKQDLINKIPMAEAVKKEKEFFKSHRAYKTLPPGYLGVDILINKLTKIYFKIIRENLPKIVKAINDQMKTADEELKSLGQPMPVDDAGKMSLLWNMLNEYCDIFRHVLQGKYNKRVSFLSDEGGYKIKILYGKLLEEYTDDYRATSSYTDENIKYALTIHEGDSIPGFPSVDAFIYLLKPQLEKLRDPIEECFNEVCAYIDMLSNKILEKTFQRFPQAISDMGELINNYLQNEKDKTKYIIDNIVDMNINYLFTNDPEYLGNYTAFVPGKKKQQQQQNNFNNNNNNFNNNNNNQNNNNFNNNNPNDPNNQNNYNQRPQGGMGLFEKGTSFIQEIRDRIEAYFKLIVRQLRDAIPKIIGNNLVKEIEDNMQIKLYNDLNESKDMTEALNEPESIAIRRKELVEMIKVMKNAQKIIRRDPDLMNVMSIKMDESDIINAGREEPRPSASESNTSLNSSVSSSQTNAIKEEPKKIPPQVNKDVKKPEVKPAQHPPQPPIKNPATTAQNNQNKGGAPQAGQAAGAAGGDKNKKTFGNLFG